MVKNTGSLREIRLPREGVAHRSSPGEAPTPGASGAGWAPEVWGFDPCEGNADNGRPNGRAISPCLPPEGGFSAAARPQSLPRNRAQEQTVKPAFLARLGPPCLLSFLLCSVIPHPSGFSGIVTRVHTYVTDMYTHIPINLVAHGVCSSVLKKRYIKKTNLEV